MNIQELLASVHEQTFDKNKLEMFHQSLVQLHSKYQLRMAELKKAKAIFIYGAQRENDKRSNVSIRTEWDASKEGQEQFEVQASIDALKSEMSSLKSRLYTSAY